MLLFLKSCFHYYSTALYVSHRLSVKDSDWRMQLQYIYPLSSGIYSTDLLNNEIYNTDLLNSEIYSTYCYWQNTEGIMDQHYVGLQQTSIFFFSFAVNTVKHTEEYCCVCDLFLYHILRILHYKKWKLLFLVSDNTFIYCIYNYSKFTTLNCDIYCERQTDIWTLSSDTWLGLTYFQDAMQRRMLP